MTPPSILLTLWLLSTTITYAFTTFTTYRRPSFNLESILAEQSSNDDALGKKAYNDDALFNFHMMTQRQKIRDYSAMDTFIDTNSLWNLAWHDSFVRNGLSDFVPPLTDSLNVLVVGGGGSNISEDLALPVALPVDFYDKDDPTIAQASSTTTTTPSLILETTTKDGSALDSSCSFLAAVFDNNILGEDKKSGSTSSDLAFTSYDCIMDQGLLADLNNNEEMGKLLYEATKRIRDMGIYVANTPPLSDETKEYLLRLGEVLGLQWVFDLDGISNENESVSVARKIPMIHKVGWQTFAGKMKRSSGT